MRVLHCNAGNMYGGVESMLATLASHRATCPEMEPHFAVCYAGRSSEELAATGVPVHVLGAARVRRPLSVLKVRRALRAVLRRESYDVVICHAAWAQALLGPAVRAAGVPLAFWLHDPPHERLSWLERWAQRTPPDFVVCNSDYTHERLRRIYPKVPSAVIYCPVAAPPPRPAGERSATRAEFGVPEQATVLIQVGRWEAHKGHKIHLEALGRLVDRRDWICWQVGAPQRPHEIAYCDEVKNLAGRLGIADRVHFLGWQPDLRRLLAAADLYCQPNSGAEPFGITFIEALYAGVPIVATPLGGPTEIVTAACGLLVPPHDPEALAAVLGGLMDDPDRRARLGSAGPDRARNLCDPAAVLNRLRQQLASVVDLRVEGANA